MGHGMWLAYIPHMNLPDSIASTLEDLEKQFGTAVSARQSLVDQVHELQQPAARNLLHYLCLRSGDIRALQDQLHIYGLSSLTSSESHILSQLQAIQARLGKQYNPEQLSACTYEFSKREMVEKNVRLFGVKKDVSIPYIMVTFDKSFAGDLEHVKNLLRSGMNVARINCAHDGKKDWQFMIEQVKTACEETGLPCKIYLDLAGPKIRTSILGKGRRKDKSKLKEGELIYLAEENAGFAKSVVVIGCTQGGIINDLKPGERVLFDDGVIECVVEKSWIGMVALRVLRIFKKKPVLKAGKGINFPDSQLSLPSLTDFDKAILPFACKHADLLGYSFVHNAADVALLQELMQNIEGNKPEIVLKIETPEAVKNLPALLFQAMQKEVFGVMIARGDLAVEIGFERMSEIQEEILWICEAAHVPVIWATQVLENLHKTGIATRSEITDAAHAVMAECVMLNKGDYTIEVIETLRDVLYRSGGHHIKKRYTFRPLRIAERFMA
jgi:pyruvate kinase